MRSGFTLVEVLVGMALGVLLIVTVQSLMIHVYRTGATLEREWHEEALADLPFELLAADLASRPAGGGLSLTEGALTIQSLNSMESQRAAARHAVQVRYSLDRQRPRAQRLTRNEAELDADGVPETSVELASELIGATIEIYDGQAWHVRWPLPSGRAPRALRLTLVDQDGSRRERLYLLAPRSWKRHDE